MSAPMRMISSRLSRMASPFQYSPRLMISSTAAGYIGSVTCGAVPSMSATPSAGITRQSSESGSDAQCMYSRAYPSSVIRSPMRFKKVDFPTPGPPFRQ